MKSNYYQYQTKNENSQTASHIRIEAVKAAVKSFFFKNLRLAYQHQKFLIQAVFVEAGVDNKVTAKAITF